MTSPLSRGGNQDSDRVSDVPGITQAKARVQTQASLMPEPLTAAPVTLLGEPGPWSKKGLQLGAKTQGKGGQDAGPYLTQILRRQREGETKR